MNRINKIFTSLNILTAAVMLVHIGIAYNKAYYNHFSAPPSASFIYALLYIPFLILINVIWIIWKSVRGKKENPPTAENAVSKASARDADRAKRANFAFIILNILVFVVMLIHNRNNIQGQNLSFFQNLFGFIWVYYIIPLILINDAWVVARMNMKRVN